MALIDSAHVVCSKIAKGFCNISAFDVQCAFDVVSIDWVAVKLNSLHSKKKNGSTAPGRMANTQPSSIAYLVGLREKSLSRVR